MSDGFNTIKIDKLKGKTLFLIDSSTYCRYEELANYSKVSLFEEILNLDKTAIFFTNEVVQELRNGPRNFFPLFIIENMINVEGSIDRTRKENRFLFEKDGKLSFIEINKVSGVDWNQVLLCQNHPELTLVTNDRKLYKSALVVLGVRVIGAASFLDTLLNIYPNNTKLLFLKNKFEDYFIEKRY